MTTGVMITLIICSTIFSMYLVASICELIRDIKDKEEDEE